MKTIESFTIPAAAAAVALALAGVNPVFAQAPVPTDPHHPGAAAGNAQTAPPPRPAPGMAMPGAAQPRAGGMMMGGDMGRMMQMMHGRMGGMQPLHRIEGQLAYFRAELRITEAQAAPWNAFAEVVRSQTDRLRQAAMPAMQGAAQPSTAPPTGPQTAPQQMERRIAALSAQIEAMRAVAAATVPLYAALSEEQRRTADELMAEHFRSMRMGVM